MKYAYTQVTRDEPEVSEEETKLVEAARANPAMFEPLYQRYVARIYRYFFFRVGREEDAADLTQQVFLKALNGLPSYRVQGVPFAAWLFRIAHHVASDTYRRRKEGVSWDFVSDDDQLNSEVNPETIFLNQERLADLRQVLTKLDPSKRELLALRFSAGLSVTEIALVIGKNHSAVKKQLTRTLQKIKEQMP